VQSQLGLGTTICFRIPLTLAIVPALMVREAGQYFALPQVHLAELIRIPQAAQNRVEEVGGALVYRLRGMLLPMVALSSLLEGGRGQRLAQSGELTVVVLRAGERLFGLAVEQVEDVQEIVVKPLGRLLAGAALFSGATVRGDGQIALILDVNAIAVQAQVQEQEQRLQQESPAASHGVSARQVLHVEAGGRKAVEMSDVVRIEQLSPEHVEWFHGRPVFQHAGRILPLIDLRERRDAHDTGIPVLVCRGGGVAVEQVLDCSEEEAVPQEGAVVLQGRVTEWLPLAEMVAREMGVVR
jgi:two-component system chemotaxis sensor kinase CheA